MKALPNSIIGLIESLEEQYPQRCLRPQETRPEADHYAGKAGLVAELRARYECEIKQNKNSLPKVLRG